MRRLAAEAIFLSLSLATPSLAVETTETRSVEVEFDGSASDKWSVVEGVDTNDGRLVFLADRAVGAMKIDDEDLPKADAGAGETAKSAEFSAKGIVFNTDTHLTQSVTIRADYGDKKVYGTVRIYKATRDAATTIETLLGYHKTGEDGVLEKSTVTGIDLVDGDGNSILNNNLTLEIQDDKKVKLRFGPDGGSHVQGPTTWEVFTHEIVQCRLELKGNSCVGATPSVDKLEVSLEVNVP